MKHLLTPDETSLLRWIVSHDAVPAEALHAHRLFMPKDGPVHVEEATGRAHCRSCGGKLAKGEQVIVFGFDPLAAGTPGSWSNLGRAYLHAEECPASSA